MKYFPVPTLSPRIKRYIAIVIGAFVFYNLNFRELGLADTVPASLLPASVIRHGDLTLDEFRDLLETSSFDGASTMGRQVQWTGAVREIDGRLRSSYPVGAALLAIPVYALPVACGWLRDFNDYRLTAKLSASLMVALAAGFVFLALTRVCALNAALLLSGLYAFGTSVWTIASQALWQHGPAMLCLAAALWLALRLREKASHWEAALLSVALGLALVCRPQVFIGVAAILAFAVVQRPRSWAALLAPAAAIGVWQLHYNWRIFHDFRGGYPAMFHSEAIDALGFDIGTAFTLPLHKGLAGLLVSPSKGLFVYTPALIVPFFALPWLAWRDRRSVAPYLLLWVFATVISVGKNHFWAAGTCYGPRYLIELTIPLTLALGTAWARLPLAIKALCGLLALYGVSVQVVGALTWECGWHHSPEWVFLAPKRLWDWRDPEILRCTEALVRSGPKPPDLAPFAR